MKAQKWLAVGLCTALTLVAALVWLNLATDRPPARYPAAPPADIAEPRVDADRTARDTVTVPETPVPPYIAEIQKRYPHLSAEEIEAMRQADMYSRGKNKIFSRCQWGRSPQYDSNGNVVGETCLESPHHEYTNETLEVLAYSDAEAARVLAMRLRHSDYDRALKLAYRSIALSGGDARILQSAEMWQVTSDNVTDVARLHQQYVIHSLRDLVEYGEYRRFRPYVERINNSSSDPNATLHELDKLVYRLYDEIKQIEIDVTGRTTIGGDDDV